MEVNLTERNVAAERKATEESVMGLKVRELNQSILERLGIVASTKGVVVVEVEPEPRRRSPVDGRRHYHRGAAACNCPAEFFNVMKSAAQPGKALLVRFIRGNNDPDITIIRVPKE